jgi:hypothetical protein
MSSLGGHEDDCERGFGSDFQSKEMEYNYKVVQDPFQPFSRSNRVQQTNTMSEVAPFSHRTLRNEALKAVNTVFHALNESQQN